LLNATQNSILWIPASISGLNSLQYVTTTIGMTYLAHNIDVEDKTPMLSSLCFAFIA
jgi:hypothetical protein